MSKIVRMNFGRDNFEYIDVRIVCYSGLNDYERWPTEEEILEVGRILADRIIKIRHKAEADWNRLYDLSFELERLTGVPQTEVWDETFKDFSTLLWKRKWAAERIRLVVSPAVPAQNYTVDPFIGWTGHTEPVYTGDEQVDKLIDKYRYAIAWNRI